MSEPCNENGAVRLANGEYESEGRLEICARGEWGTVCNDRNGGRHPDGFDLNAAIVACRQLGYTRYGELATIRSYMVIVGSVQRNSTRIYTSIRRDYKRFFR